jgi:TonB family protein
MTNRILPVFALALSAACMAPSGARADGADRIPQVTDQEAPEYPFSLRLQGKRGEVTIQFDVETDGTVSHPEVVKSTHPDFEAPAVEAVLKWKFKPGMKDGKVVAVHMQVPIYFEIHYMPDGSKGVPVWQIPSSAPKKFPAQFQYDDPPKPLVINAPVYPFELLEKKVKGSASVTFAVDETGHTHVLKIVSATLPEFGAVTAAMVAAWTFEPAQKDGKPSWALLRKDQVFSSYGDEFPMNDSAERLLKALRKNRSSILRTPGELDGPIRARFQPGPIVPEPLEAAGTAADADIEFIVDHAGHAQLPRVVSASDPDFGWAAATAVSRWQFTVPTSKGKPVDVFVRIPMAYKPQNSAAPKP